MDILTFDQLPQGGFAGLKERRLVTDQRVFGRNKAPHTFNGLGNFVYLADANFMPHGETTMHGHKEIDVVSVMVDGRISHEGSLEHGQGLEAGYSQVQRAGAQGFEHNEVNPDGQSNQMIQLWVMPDQAGEPAGYKVYEPNVGELQHIYGGTDKSADSATFYSQTHISVANAKAGQSFTIKGQAMAYISKGSGDMNGDPLQTRTLVHNDDGLSFKASEDSQIIFVHLAQE